MIPTDLSELGKVCPDFVQCGGGGESPHEYLLSSGDHLKTKQTNYLNTIFQHPLAESYSVQQHTLGVDSLGKATFGSIFFPFN